MTNGRACRGLDYPSAARHAIASLLKSFDLVGRLDIILF